MKRATLPLLPLLLACGVETVEPPPAQMMMPPVMQPDPMPSNDCASQQAGQTIQASGEVSGFWSGRVELSGQTTIAAGQRLEICPGTTIAPSSDARLVVVGELVISGTREQMVTFEETNWSGIQVEGKLTGGYVSMSGASICIDGRAGSEIELVSGLLTGCRQAFNLANGATFDRVTVLGGSSVYVRGGVLTMVDSTIDLRHPTASPDCAVWAGGGANLDHVRFTGCHCPIHIGRAELGTTVTNSIFDGASIPIMIAGTSGIFTGNNILEGAPQLLDIGSGIAVDFGGNYWGGGAPYASSGDMSQFQNLNDYSTAPFEGAGPR